MKAIIAIIVIILLGAGGYLLYKHLPAPAPADTNTATTTDTTPVATTTDNENSAVETIGTSAGGRNLVAYHYGTGDKEILFVGGIHGGYEWNTSVVAYQLMDYLQSNPDAIPENEKITVIPVLNPDGLSKVVDKEGPFTASDVPSGADTVPGRFNANNVDLNRNFDCDWQASGTWQDKTVSGGTAAFSEPESQAMRDYVAKHDPAAVVIWYSAAGGVYASNCHSGVSAETEALTDLYAKASGYTANDSYDFYALTGDMANWLAKNGTPAISVLLTNHTSTEWDKNQKGIDAVLAHYAQ